VTYTLCQGTTKTGVKRYYFSTKPKGTIPDSIPEGYHVNENVNGQVSLSKVRPRQITPVELETVLKALAKHPKAANFRADIKGKRIRVFESTDMDVDQILKIFQPALPLPPSRVEAFRHHYERHQQFREFLRFELVDKTARKFQAHRETYSGRGGWSRIGLSSRLETLVEEIIPLLDTDEYFEYF
jgi:hypothetical protein